MDERKGEDAKNTADMHRDLVQVIADIRESGSLDSILECERLALQDEKKRLVTSSSMAGSLSAALEGLDQAVAMLPRVRDPERYTEVAATYRNHHHQIGGLPRDDARMFFSAHGTRLLNVSKSPLPHPVQAVLSERLRNMRAAEKLYRDLQLQALGL